MVAIEVKIVEHHERPMKFLNGNPGVDAKNLEFGIIERGTATGQTVIAIKMETPEGENVFAEITKNQFEMLCGVWLGANQRFRDKIRKN